MRTRIERAVTEKKIYVADDGKEFLREDDCCEYERDIVYNKALKAYRRLRKFDAAPPFCIDGDFVWTWVYLTNKEDLDTVKSVFYCDDCTAIDYTPENYPCWAVFTHDGSEYGEAVGTISDYREDVLKYIERVIEKQHETTLKKTKFEPKQCVM